MAKTEKGFGSEKRATGIVQHNGMEHEVNIGPSKAGVAKSRGWGDAVQMTRPGEITKVHENMAKAKARLEAHPGFKGWKGQPKDT